MTEDEFEQKFLELLSEAMVAAKDNKFAGALIMRLTKALVTVASAKTYGDPKAFNDLLETISQSMFEMAHDSLPMGKLMAAFDRLERGGAA
jgi:hypothetical protein